jgi:uncharacterized phage-associated protein
MSRLRFRFDKIKFVNAVAYLSRLCPNSTKLTICKLLYFADKEHLVKYGRPITGDQYHHLKDGQIPTRGLDMLRGKSDAASNALLEKYVTVIGNSVHPKKAAEKKVFSKSDLRILSTVVERYGKLNAHQLWNLAHAELTCKETEVGDVIDFALFFKGRPEAESVRALAEQEQESRDVLRSYAVTQ